MNPELMLATFLFLIFGGLLCAAVRAKLPRNGKSKSARLTMPVTARITDILKEERTEWKEDRFGIKRARTWLVNTSILEYEVGGKVYRKLHSGPGTTKRAAVGDAITIFCNPDNPSEAGYRARAFGIFGALGRKM